MRRFLRRRPVKTGPSCAIEPPQDDAVTSSPCSSTTKTSISISSIPFDLSRSKLPLDSESSTTPSCRDSLVSFSDSRPQIFHVPHLDDYSRDEIKACWYSEFERESMRDEHLQSIKIHRHKLNSSEKSQKNTTKAKSQRLMDAAFVEVFCPRRGLETWVDDESNAEDLRKQSISAVLEEQEELRNKQSRASQRFSASDSHGSTSSSRGLPPRRSQQQHSRRVLVQDSASSRRKSTFSKSLDWSDKLASRYSMYTQGARLHAQFLGLLDEQEQKGGL